MRKVDFAHAGQELIQRLIEADEDIRASGSRIMIQDDKDIGYLLECSLAQLDAPLVVITVDHVTPEDDSSAEISGDITVSESVPLNRSRPDYMTAMKLAQFIGQILRSKKIGWTDTDQKAGEDGVLIASSRYKAIIKVEEGNK